MVRSRSDWTLQGRQLLLCFIHPPEAGRAEEHDGILNLLAAKPSQRFSILGEDAQNAAIGTIQEIRVEISQGRGAQRVSRRRIIFLVVGHAGLHWWPGARADGRDSGYLPKCPPPGRSTP